MCGGRLETLPCSHVGHIFRKGGAYKLENSPNDRKNFERVAQVWMDEFKTLYYQRTKTSQVCLHLFNKMFNFYSAECKPLNHLYSAYSYGDYVNVTQAWLLKWKIWLLIDKHLSHELHDTCVITIRIWWVFLNKNLNEPSN